jgi:hypothetical protein
MANVLPRRKAGRVVAMDVLAPGIGEIIGGSQREERLEVMDRSMAERGIDREHSQCRRVLSNAYQTAIFRSDRHISRSRSTDGQAQRGA